MSYQPTPYADADSPTAMSSDCSACAHEMRLPQHHDFSSRVMGQAPSIAYDRFPQDVAKPVIAVSDAAARLASALHLHLD